MKELDLKNNLAKRVNEADLFSKRFGSFNKSDYEVLMFTVYLDCLEHEARDYEISEILGIPESKVRTLRVKSQLQYPRDIKWEEELISAINHGFYDPNQKTATISVENPSVRNYIRYKVEEKIGTVNISLNTKKVILPLEFILLLAAITEDDTENTLKLLHSKLLECGVNDINDGNFRNRYLKKVNNMSSVLTDISIIFVNGKPILDSLIKLIG